MKKLRLAVLVSGGGTNLQAMIDRCAAGSLLADIAVVVSDRSGAYGLKRAEKAGIPAFCVDYGSYLTRDVTEEFLGKLPVDLVDLDRGQNILRESDPIRRWARLARLVAAERELIEIIDAHRPDYVCLAGFMRLVTPYFIGHFNSGGARKILNIHPALLPSFPGSHGYEDTFGYGCKWGGVTVHFVDEGEDTGPIIAQAVYPIWADDDVEKVRARGLELEYEVYPQVINWLARGYVKLEEPSGKRTRVVVTDPKYSDIVSGWARRGLE